MDELLGVEGIAHYLEVQPTTVQRWCREGSLPCLKVGKAWRVRRSALDDFLRRAERRRTLVDHLRAFVTVPDHLVAVAKDAALLSGLDAAFFRVGEAHGGVLVKFAGGEARPEADLRAGLAAHGLELDRLEAEGRLLWRDEADPGTGREAALRRVLSETAAAGRSVWVSFDWTKGVDVATMLRQQEAVATLVEARALVVKTGVVEAVADAWTPAEQRRAQRAHRGQIRVARDGVLLCRSVPLGEEATPSGRGPLVGPA